LTRQVSWGIAVDVLCKSSLVIMRKDYSGMKHRRRLGIAGRFVLAASVAVLVVAPASLAGAAVGPRVSFNPSPSVGVQFGDQPVGTTSSARSVVATNTGDTNLTISDVALSGTHAADFVVTVDTCTAAVVAPAGTCSVSVMFTPSAGGVRVAGLFLHDDAPGSPQGEPLAGNGSVPAATISPSSALQFGNVAVGTSAPARQVTVTSGGSAPLTVTDVAVVGTNPADFAIAADTCTGSVLAPAAACTLSVVFSPNAEGSRTAQLRIVDDAPTSPQLLFLGGIGLMAKATVTPSAITFSAQGVGTTSASRTVTVVSQQSGAPLEVGSVDVIGADLGEFVIGADTCTGAVLSYGQFCTVDVAFAPTRSGSASATLHFLHNAAGGASTVALTGTGV
jgi:hypothetical protein